MYVRALGTPCYTVCSAGYMGIVGGIVGTYRSIIMV